MMADDFRTPFMLHVEGKTDLHPIVHLLARHDIELDEKLGPVVIKNMKNDDGVLDQIRLTGLNAEAPVGFVLDADDDIQARWRSVCGRLGVPEKPDIRDYASGLVASSKFGVKIGVWIMPDNVTPQGNLESFLQTLIPREDLLLPLARRATGEARQAGARFSPKHQSKAELHCWLAWQKKPGKPFGQAVTAKYFDKNAEPAVRFVAWFRQLYDL